MNAIGFPNLAVTQDDLQAGIAEAIAASQATSPGSVVPGVTTALFLNSVTALSGGQSNCLDAFPTLVNNVPLPCPYWVSFNIPGQGTVNFYRTAGANTTGAGIVRALDANNSTNNYYWLQGS